MLHFCHVFICSTILRNVLRSPRIIKFKNGFSGFNESASVFSWSFSEYPAWAMSNSLDSSSFGATLSVPVVVFYFCPPLLDGPSVEAVFVYFS